MRTSLRWLSGVGLLVVLGCGGGSSGAPVVLAPVVLTSPNGGETWVAGEMEAVTWQPGDFGGDLDIEVSLDDGASWSLLATATPNDGSEDVLVPGTPSALARVRVSASDADPNVVEAPSDGSDAAFSIVAPLAVTDPNGGEIWVAGTSRDVLWTTGVFPGTVDIDVSTDGGTTWSALVAGVANDGTETVVVPDTPSGTVRVQVSAADGDPATPLSPADASDGDFEIREPFTDLGAGLPGVGEPTPMGAEAAVAWGDVDGDGDLDVVIAGRTGAPSYGPITRIYRNDGGGAFTDIAAGLPGLGSDGAVALAWGDYDGDGDLDLALAGSAGAPIYAGIARIYRNDGAGAFTDIAAGLPPIGAFGGATLAWGDYDGDGDLDLALAGEAGAPIYAPVTRVYRNDGAGVFTDIAAGLPGIGAGTPEGSQAALAWGDFDGDGDLDLAICGRAGAPIYSGITRIYRNDGTGVFTDIAAGLPGLGDLGSATLAWGDYDADGDLDLALAGSVGAPIYGAVTRIYRNDGAGTFTDIVAGLVGVGESSPSGAQAAAAWGDVDGDGDLDLAVGGRAGAPTYDGVTLVYRNDGAGTFTDMGADLPGIGHYGSSALAWGDVDGDGDLDLAVVGTVGAPTYGSIARIYRNDLAAPNSPPSAPADLDAQTAPGLLLLTWQPATDLETPEAGLTYNLRIGTTPTGDDVFAGMADARGRRLLPAFGSWLHDPYYDWAWLALPSGVYFASVQAIDASFAGGPWTDPIVFIVP